MVDLAGVGSLLGGVGGLIDNFTKTDYPQEKAWWRSRRLALELGKIEYERQKQFAQQGVRWKVADAQKAGISPLAAMGMQPASYSPSMVADSPSDFTPRSTTDFASAGQSIGNALALTQREKLSAYQMEAQNLSLQKMRLENALLAGQAIRTVSPGRQAAMPETGNPYLVDGQGNAPLQPVPVIPVQRGDLVNTVPMQQTASDPAHGNREPGAVNDVGYARTNAGYSPVPSNDVKNRIEDNLVPELMWAYRNMLLPSLGFNLSPPSTPTAPGKKWYYNYLTQEYRQYNPNRFRK